MIESNMSLTVGEAYNSFEEFNSTLISYSRQHFVLYTIADSQTVENANLKLTSGKTKFSDRFKYRYVLFQCKHAEKNKKKKVKGLGLRPHQRTFNQLCTAELYVSIDRKKDRLVIHRHNEKHNHPTDENIYTQYPEQRRLTDNEKETTETMLNMGVKVKLLQDYLQSSGQHFVSVKDLHNLRQSNKKMKYGDKSDEEILIDELAEMNKKDPDAVTTVMLDDNKVLQSLLIVTGDMKRLFHLYPEIIFIDGTYSINKLRMPMYSFIVEDGNGCGQSVGFAFVGNEKTETLEGVLGQLGKIHDLSKVRVAVVDKALNEITAIKKTMPGVSIQLCKFHVMKKIISPSIHVHLNTNRNLHRHPSIGHEPPPGRSSVHPSMVWYISIPTATSIVISHPSICHKPPPGRSSVHPSMKSFTWFVNTTGTRTIPNVTSFVISHPSICHEPPPGRSSVHPSMYILPPLPKVVFLPTSKLSSCPGRPKINKHSADFFSFKGPFQGQNIMHRVQF